MRQIKFTITENEIRAVAKKIGREDLSDKQIPEILHMLECDETLAEESISSAIRYVLAPF